jgi:hypothetical protein
MRKSRKHSLIAVLGLIVLVTLGIQAQTRESQSSDLHLLSREFFQWRARTQPPSSDDIPRIERPPGWVPDVSPLGMSEQFAKYREFRSRLDAIPRSGWTRSDSVDYLLLRSAIERVNWELRVLRAPIRNPDYYVQETLGAVYELLLISSPMTEARTKEIIFRLESIPLTLKDGRDNLTDPTLPFAHIALANLDDVRNKLLRTSAALKGICATKFFGQIDHATAEASDALEAYAKWIRSRLPSMTSQFRVGREGYEYYLRNIALIPYSPQEMLEMGKNEFARAVTCEAVEKARSESLPALPIFKSAAEQIRQSARDEDSIRVFLTAHHLMTIPSSMHHYRKALTPSLVQPLSHMGVTDDLTSESRLDEDGISYMPEPSENLPFFHKASALDPRPIILHEGIPGHYFQLVRSWKNPDEIRRHFYDPGPIEGIGFYVEELALQAGLFDVDRPQTKEIIYRFMRLRALRVEADINLALGTFDVREAAEYLASSVPMDRQTAEGEAAFFAYNPGQAISYQIGKIQIERFLADARTRKGSSFQLVRFHDYLMENGNVPIALLRFEYLGLRDEISKLW